MYDATFLSVDFFCSLTPFLQQYTPQAILQGLSELTAQAEQESDALAAAFHSRNNCTHRHYSPRRSISSLILGAVPLDKFLEDYVVKRKV